MLSTSTSLSRSRSSGSKKGLALSLSKGFTLVELLVVVSIMLIITSTLLLQQQKFNSATLMRTLAYNIALSIRQAQVYGTSVVGTNQSGATTFAAGYGIYFSSTVDYLLFADFNNNGRYNSGNEEHKKTFTLGSGYTISNFCAVVTPSSYYCKSGGTGTNITSIAISFKRPNPDAQLVELTDVSTAVSSAYIQLKSPGGDTRAISVTTTGQISVCGVNKTIPDC